MWEALLQAQHTATGFHLVASWPVVEAVQVSVNFLDTRAGLSHLHGACHLGAAGLSTPKLLILRL